MFTGIVQGTATVTEIIQEKGYITLFLAFDKKYLKNLVVGCSVSINGVCLTVVSLNDEGIIELDVIDNSLSITNLNSLNIGDFCNFERSYKSEDEIGGHILSGHADFSSKIKKIIDVNVNFGIQISFNKKFSKYIFTKGFIAINGCSLTVSEVNKDENHFLIWIIPETLRVTNLSRLKVDSYVNVELDRKTQVLVDTISDIAEKKFGEIENILSALVNKTDIIKELNSGIIDAEKKE